MGEILVKGHNLAEIIWKVSINLKMAFAAIECKKIFFNVYLYLVSILHIRHLADMQSRLRKASAVITKLGTIWNNKTVIQKTKLKL